MNFQSATIQCKPGQYIKSERAGWDEHHVQYGRDEKGNLFWTAGNTVGGALKRKDYTRAMLIANDYAVYDHFGSTSPLDLKEVHPSISTE